MRGRDLNQEENDHGEQGNQPKANIKSDIVSD